MNDNSKDKNGWGRGMFIAGAAAGQSKGMPKGEAPWPVRCTCGEAIADAAALRAHAATCVKFQ
jgi:hypothetical protein